MATSDATVTDVEMLEQIHADLHRRTLFPGEHIVLVGYTSAELMSRRSHTIHSATRI